jgi:hypothetical protein
MKIWDQKEPKLKNQKIWGQICTFSKKRRKKKKKKERNDHSWQTMPI